MNSRDSRFELLRLIAIFFVVCHHLLLFGADVCGYLSPYSVEGKGIVGIVLNSVVVTGVNLFVLITGWFGARRVWRPMLRLVVECAFFGALSYGLCLLLYCWLPIKEISGEWSWLRLWESLKFTNWWFIVHYMLLLLCAPLLERALDGIGRRQMESLVLCAIVFNVVFGFWWGFLNKSGYNVLNFILLYLLARYMRLYPQAMANRLLSRRAWLAVALCVGLMTMFFLFDKGAWQPNHTPMVWNYNCPLVLLESVALFSLFGRIRLQSRRVNYLATLVLGVYLIQSSPNLVYYRNLLGRELFERFSYAGLLVAAVMLALVCAVLSAGIGALLRLIRVR